MQTKINHAGAALWRPPSGQSVEAVEAGRWWDACRVPGRLGARVLAELGDATGATIYDPYGQVLYWLTRPGATRDWELPGIQPLGAASYVGVPPGHRTDGPGVRWLVPLSRDRYLTRPDRLYTALAATTPTAARPPAEERCFSCGNTTSHPAQVHDEHGALDHACPYCAPVYEPGPGLRELFAAAEPYREEAAL